MGKTPVKWIKALLSGKKSKSNPSKMKDSFKPSSNKDMLAVSSEALLSDPIVDLSLISQSTSVATATKGSLSEKGLASELSNDRVIPSARDEETNAQAVVSFGSQDDPEKIRLNQAAIKAQAAFRGHQARRAFQTLKGIVQLQALIRGHLVRRQAVSTLYCVKGIVKVQALARGNKVRRSDIGLAVHKIRRDTKCLNAVGVSTSTLTEKLSESVFVQKLLASSPSAFPVCINYGPGEPNLTWDWLDCWTKSQFWAPLPVPESKTKLDSVSNDKNCNSQTVGKNEGLVKRNARKSSGVKVNDGPISDSNKNKQRPKKVSTHPLHSGQDNPVNPQKEVEKSNLKKPFRQNVSDRSETANGEGKDMPRKVSGHAVTDVSEHGPNVSAEKVKEPVSKSKQSDNEPSLAQQAEDEHDSHVANLLTRLKNGKDDDGIQGVSDDLNCSGNYISSVSPKTCQRRASLPAKFDSQDDGVQRTPRLPSYMAPTESAKARLRGQDSPRLATDLVEKNGPTRRHSLSSSINGKLGSFSPRAERLVALSSKGIIRTDRSLSSSKDGSEKLIQPQWRR